MGKACSSTTFRLRGAQYIILFFEGHTWVHCRGSGEDMGLAMQGLSPEQLAQYERDGFLVLPNFTAQEEVDAMRKRAGEIVDAFEPSTFTVFSTKGQVRRECGCGCVRGGASCIEGADMRKDNNERCVVYVT